jgi:hypothetical protein
MPSPESQTYGNWVAGLQTPAMRAWVDAGTVYWYSDSRVFNAVEASGTWIKYFDFGFGIPAGATIVGVRLGHRRQASANDASNYIKDLDVRLDKSATITDSSPTNNAKITSWSTSVLMESVSYGTTTDTWGWSTAQLSPANVNSVNFGYYVRPKIKNVTLVVTARLRYANNPPEISVWYSLPAVGVQVWNGTAFQAVAGVKKWDGASWIDVPVMKWDGASWVVL